MLNRIWQLTKLYLKTALFLNTNSGKKKRSWGIYAVYAFLFIYLAVVAGGMSYAIIDSLIPLRQTAVFVGIILASNLILTFVETIISGMNILYFTKDNEYILPMPIKAFEIVAAKINSLLIFGYASELFLGIIPFAIYGVMTGAPWYFYIMMVLVLIILPIFPTVLAALIVMFFMSFTKVVKNKGLIQILGIFLIMGISFGVSYFSSSSSSMQTSQIVEMLFRVNGLVDIFRNLFPTLGWAIDVLCSEAFIDGLIAFALLIASNALIYFVFATLSYKLYFKGLVGSLYSSGGTSKKKIDSKTAYRSSGVGVTYILKEFKMLFRKTIYFTQCALPSLILPAFMALIFYFSLGRGLNEGGGDISIITSVLNDSQFATLVYAGVMCYASFCSMYVYCGITAVSRDGESAVFMKYIPVSFAWQVIYKATPDFVFMMVSELFVVILCVLLSIPLPIIILSILTFIPYAIIHSLVAIILDLKKPKLNWSNEYQVVKNNLRIFWISAVGLANLLLSAVPFLVGEVPLLYIAPIYIIVYGLIAAFLLRYVFKKDFALSAKIY